MSDHPVGHILYSTDGQQVAIRTIHDHPQMRWNVATSVAGARNASDDEVADWLDTPPEPSE